MSDPIELAGASGAAATIVGGLMRWWHNRDEAAAAAARSAQQASTATTLALLLQKVEQIADSQKKHDNFGERLALVEQSLTAAHERLDHHQPPRRKRE